MSLTDTFVRAETQASTNSTATPDLRDYQSDVCARFESEVAQGQCRILLVAPTGSGKTVIASAIIKNAARRVLVVAHRREIVNQTSAKLTAFGVHHGVIQAGDDDKLRPMAPVQVASIQTLHARAIRSASMPMPLADLVIIDEAHHSCAQTYRAVLEQYPNAIVLGLTATPCRGDGRGLGGIFTTLIQCPQIAELIEGGYLVKTRVYAPVIEPDLKGVRTQAGDYVESQLAERMDQDKLVGDIVTHWLKYGEGRRTVAFACSVGHSVHIADEFVKAGIRAEHLDGETSIEDRSAILGRLASGETQVVCNCMVLTEGFDCPDIGCIILARPTKKMGLFRQMVGRVLRPATGKPDAIVLDHSGAVFRHGLPEDYVAWTLDPDKRATAPAHQQRLGSKDKRDGLLECTQCNALRLGGKPCPNCGFMPKRPAEFIATAAGELGLVRNGRVQVPLYSPEDRARWHGMLTGVATERGYKPGWIAHKYKEKFGDWPARGNTVNPIKPTPEVLSWVRSRNIAFAKARQRDAV
jgi:superfamily II DNA or RNA helicase